MTSLLTFLVFASINLLSQNNIVIKYTYVKSLNQPGVNLKSFNAGLYITNTKALFVAQIDSLENGRKRISKTVKTKDGGMMAVSASSSEKGIYNITDRVSDTLYSNAEFSTKFIYKEKVPKIDWKIARKTKKIDGIKVQKAATHFRGRDYTAWFAPEIPVALGPWKLQGLPGLIIEAYDKNKEILFLFKKIEMPYNKPINFPALNQDWLHFSDFVKEQDNVVEENLKYARSLSFGFDTKASENEEQELRNSLFIELFKKD